MFAYILRKSKSRDRICCFVRTDAVVSN